MSAEIRISRIQAAERSLKIRFSDGSENRFHWFWLRENCPCPKCHHPQTWERVVDSWSLDKDINAEKCEISDDGDILNIHWASADVEGSQNESEHKTSIPTDWLYSHAYDKGLVEDGMPEITTWTVDGLGDKPSVEASDVLNSDASLAEFISQVKSYGLSIVKNLPCEIGAVEKLAERVGFLRETHFGSDFTVVSKPDPNNVAYTTIELKAHTDLPNLEMPPGIQFLHCLEFDADGGESILVDGFAVAERLKIENPKAFADLVRIPVNFRFVDDEWDLRWYSPTIRLNAKGEIEEVRYHNALTAALDVDFDDVEQLYEGLRCFTEILRRPEYELKFKLSPGDVMAFHNRRLLHGRAAFDPNTGPRMLRGCYVDCDQAWSKLRVLKNLNKL